MCVKPRVTYSPAVTHHGGVTKPARKSSAGLSCPPATHTGADALPSGATSVSAYEPRRRPYVIVQVRAPAGTSPVKRSVAGGRSEGAPGTSAVAADGGAGPFGAVGR